MMLFVLTTIFGYDLKKAVGTNVFIMTFTAMTRAVSHFAIAQSFPSWILVILCIISTLVFSIIGSFIANKVDKTRFEEP